MKIRLEWVKLQVYLYSLTGNIMLCKKTVLIKFRKSYDVADIICLFIFMSVFRFIAEYLRRFKITGTIVSLFPKKLEQ